MSANIGIKENDKTKNFTVNSLMIDLQNNGGLSEWVLESDLKLDTISIDRNGTYTSSSDYYGFSQATVNVMQIVQGKEDDKPKIIAVDPNTGEIVETEVPTDFPTIGGDTPWIVGNDPDTGSPVIVAADGGGTVHETGVDPEFLPVIDNIIDKGLCDPYVPGTDDNGDEVVTTYYQNTDDLVRQSLPSSISIIVPPTKLEYNNGEVINTGGMVVAAQMASGGTWTNASYPNGHIPIGQLIIDPNVATGDTDGVITVDIDVDGTSKSLNFASVSVKDVWTTWTSPETVVTEVEGSPTVTKTVNSAGVTSEYFISSNQFKISGARTNGWYPFATSGTAYAHNGNVYYVYVRDYSGDIGDPYPTSSYCSLDDILGAYDDVKNGAGSTSQAIAVKWKRPVDGKELETGFSITVLNSIAGGSSDDGSGYSDDSGGSESGGGTHF